jgi:hypothetical protein
VIEVVGHTFELAQDFTGHHLADEDGVRAHVHLLGNSGFEVGDGIIRDNGRAGLAELVVAALELVDVPARLEAEATDEGQGRVHTQDGHGKGAAIFNILPGQIVLVDADGDGRRLRSHLEHGVGDLSVELIALL